MPMLWAVYGLRPKNSSHTFLTSWKGPHGAPRKVPLPKRARLIQQTAAGTRSAQTKSSTISSTSAAFENSLAWCTSIQLYFEHVNPITHAPS